MAATTDDEQRVELSEYDIERKVGDLTFRQRLVSELLSADRGTSKDYGGLTIQRTARGIAVFDIDGFPLTMVPGDKEPNEIVSKVDQMLEDALNHL